MQRFEFKEIRHNLYSIEQEFVRSYLIIGSQKAILIDSGMGGNQLHKQVEERTSLPLEIIFTHADPDHIGDAKDFDTRYMHPDEFDYYASKVKDPLVMNPLNEGDKVDVGSYHFEVIHIPGHTPGSIALLEGKERFMIVGDMIQDGPIFMFGQGRDFTRFIQSMDKLLEYQKDVDVFFASHFDLELPVSIAKTLREGAKKIQKGEIEGIPEPRFDGKIKRYTYENVAFYAI